jgi:HlyD family secretion protein
MSPVLQPSVAPQPAPERHGPEVVAPPPRSSGRIKWFLLAGLVVLAASIPVVVRNRQSQKPATPAVVRTAKAVRGVLSNTVRLSGSIAATNYADIVAPRLQAPDQGRGLVLLYLPPSGEAVRTGEKIAEMDGLSARDHLEDVNAQVAQGEMDLLRVKANLAAEMETVRQKLRVALGNLQKAQQDLRAAETKNRIDQELLKLNVSEAQAKYDEAQRQVQMYVERQAATLRIAELNQEGQIRHRNRHQHDIDRLVINAPMSGRMIRRTIFRHGEQAQVQVGDELSPGQFFARIIDASSLRMDTAMNQAESELVRVGQPARIRFDAYPEIQLNGKVQSVGTIAAGGRRVNYYIRTVPVRIAIEGNDPRVLPDLTASADVLIAQQDDSIIVPRQAVVEEDGKPVVYVRQAGVFAPREVALGITSNTEVTVLSGLQPGEEVALERPF